MGLAVIFGSASVASAETRTLKIYYVHTKERAEVTFKKNGRYIKSGLDQFNHLTRDWRRNEPTSMDPRLLDLLWEAYRASGSRDYIHVVSGYRSPATNNMLRSRSSGVAKKSQHMLGKAVDFYLPDVKLANLRNIGLKMHGGGVGYYPKSGSPFIHLDVGSVRHWPGISRKELASVFPDGKTVHIPSDGKPLPGYQQALAMVKQRQAGGGSIQMAAAEPAKPRRGGGLLGRIFGGGADEAEDNADTGQVQVAAAPQRRQAPQPAPAVIQPPAPETPGMILAALPLTSLPIPQAAPRRAETPAAAPVEAVAVAAAPAAPDVPDYIPFGTGTPAPAAVVASNIPLPTRRPDFTPAAAPTQVAMATESATASDSDVQLPQTAYVMPSRRPDTARGADVIASLLAKEPANAVTVAPEATEEVASLAFAAPSAPAPAASSARAGAEASPQLALVSEAAARPVASPAARSDVRVAPKGARPSATDLPKTAKPNVQLVSTKVPAIMMESVPVAQNTQGIETVAYSDRLAEVPTTVYTAGFTQSGDRADPRKFSGKAVTFLSIAKFQ